MPELMDLAKLAAIVANILGGVALLSVVIFAVVAYLKQWGVKGRWLTGSAFGVGLAIALLVRYAMAPMATFSDWVWAGLFGLMAGALATGAYKGAADVTGKTVAVELVEALQEDPDPSNV